VNINDPISSLKDYYKIKGGSLNVVYKGAIIATEDTYLKKLVKAHDRFVLMSGSLEMKLWKRFPSLY